MPAKRVESMVVKVRVGGIEKLPEACSILLPLRESSAMKFDEAAEVAMQFTRETGVETGFRYDASTEKLLTPIYGGGTCGIKFPPTAGKGKHATGDFHVHPMRSTCLHNIIDQYYYFTNKGYLSEVSLGCPDKGNLVRRITINPDWASDGTFLGKKEQPSQDQFHKFPQVNYWLHGGKRHPAPAGEGSPPPPNLVGQWKKEPWWEEEKWERMEKRWREED